MSLFTLVLDLEIFTKGFGLGLGTFLKVSITRLVAAINSVLLFTKLGFVEMLPVSRSHANLLGR